jgi:LPS-assembly protein
MQFPSAAGLQSPVLRLARFPVQTSQSASPSLMQAPSPVAGQVTTIRATQQEKAGNVYKARGNVELDYRDYVIFADEATYDSSTGLVTATGHVVLDGGPNDEHIEASHGTYNVRTATGTFYDVVGTTGLRARGGRNVLTSSNPFAFTGKVVEKVSLDRYIVHNGTVTSCRVPHPKWTFKSSRVVVDVGGTAKIYNGLFRIKGIPVFYFPFADHPVERLPRQTGFLMPTFGTSSRKGTILGEGFYWAINRSMDALFGFDYYSQRGWAEHATFRAMPNDHTWFQASFYGVEDRGYNPFPARLNPNLCSSVAGRLCKQGGQDIRTTFNTTLDKNWRAVANLDYLSSFLFRLAFDQVFTSAITSEVTSNAFVSRSGRGYSFNAVVDRYQDFQSTVPGDAITILHAPSFDLSSLDRPIAHSPFYWSFDTSLDGVARSERDPATGLILRSGTLVGRFDARPDVSLPLRFRGWMFRPELALRDTVYTESAAPMGSTELTIGTPANRKAAELAVNLRPPGLTRLFQHRFLDKKWKHVVEPEVTYRYVKGVDNFTSIPRFDLRDTLSDTNEVEYDLTNRIFAKSPPRKDCEPPCDPKESPAREVLMWRVGQKYFFDPTFGGILVPGRTSVNESTVNFTGVTFLDQPRYSSPVISRLNASIGPVGIIWDLDYDLRKGRTISSVQGLTYGFGQFGLAANYALLQGPGEQSLPAAPLKSVPANCFLNPVANQTALLCPFSQYRLLARYGRTNRVGFNIAGAVGIDAKLHTVQYSAFQGAYNWDCCGVSFEVRRFAVGPIQNENQYRFAFTVANIGSFGNLRARERIF